MVSARREPPTCGKSTPAADKCAAVQPLGHAPRPRYSRAMCGGCVSWLTPCEKKSRRHSPSWAKGRPAAKLRRAAHNAPPTRSENASDRVSRPMRATVASASACLCGSSGARTGAGSSSTGFSLDPATRPGHAGSRPKSLSMGGHDPGVTSPDRSGAHLGPAEARLLAENPPGPMSAGARRNRLRREGNNRVSRHADVQGSIACERRPKVSN